MRLLLDTHVLIWFAAASPRLSRRAVDVVVSGSHELCVSFVSGWEYGIKRQRHPGVFPLDFAALLEPLTYSALGIDYGLYRYAESLPAIHRDPFDRMLVAQALAADMTIVTADETIRQYPVRTLW